MNVRSTWYLKTFSFDLVAENSSSYWLFGQVQATESIAMFAWALIAFFRWLLKSKVRHKRWGKVLKSRGYACFPRLSANKIEGKGSRVRGSFPRLIDEDLAFLDLMSSSRL